MSTIDVHRARELAHEFAVVLRRDLTHEQLAQVNARNEVEEDSSICHTHDFCDANESMAEAFERLFSRPMTFDEDDTALVHEAWSIAKNDRFQPLY